MTREERAPASRVAALTAELHRRYFATHEMNVSGMSSHWREFAPRSSVRLDAAGVPVDAVGVGFGDMNRRRRGNTVFTALAAAAHALSHPAKRRVAGAIAATRQTSRRAGLVFNQDALRQALTLALLREHLEHEPVRRILMIGDGYGLLGAVLAAWRPSAQVIFVDLGRSLLFQALTCGRVFPSASHALVGVDDAASIERSRFVYCPVDGLDALPLLPVDLAVNIASMQEMDAETVAGYFDMLRRAGTRWFYCCNRDRKVMPGGEVAEFLKYPWSPRDVHVVDGPCPWHQWFVGPRRTAGPLPLSLRIPYDGPHLHRLTRLAPAA